MCVIFRIIIHVNVAQHTGLPNYYVHNVQNYNRFSSVDSRLQVKGSL